MIKQSDVEGRLRLFRYGLVVIVIVTFLISLLAPFFALQGLGSDAPPITDHIGTAILITVIVAVLMGVAYFAYSMVLQRTVGGEAETSA